jgi:hypothetical protein
MKRLPTVIEEAFKKAVESKTKKKKEDIQSSILTTKAVDKPSIRVKDESIAENK